MNISKDDALLMNMPEQDDMLMSIRLREWMDLKQQRDDLLAALRLILPMADGYARMHTRGNNAAFVEQAKAALAKAETT